MPRRQRRDALYNFVKIYAYMHACVRECVRGREDECCGMMRLSERSASDSGLERERVRLLKQDKEALM